MNYFSFKLKKTFVFSAFLVFLLLILIEVAAILIEKVKRQDDVSQISPIIKKQSYGDEYGKDVKNYNWKKEYEKFVAFKEIGHISKTININKNGIRKTSGNCEKQNAKLVFVFGGSTTLGVAVPDSMTYPSYLAKKLNTNGKCYKVVNYGTGWWMSSQSNNKFSELLRHGKVPDIAIFYEGINDLDVVSYGGVPGGIAPYAERILSKSFDTFTLQDKTSLEKIKKSIKTFLHITASYRLAVAYYHGRKYSKSKKNIYKVDDEYLNKSASAVSNIFVENMQQNHDIGNRHGVKVLTALQPFPLISNKKLTIDEKITIQYRIDIRPWEAKFIKITYNKILEKSDQFGSRCFYDMSKIFDDNETELFAEAEHLLPTGNEIIAESFYQKIVACDK